MANPSPSSASNTFSESEGPDTFQAQRQQREQKIAADEKKADEARKRKTPAKRARKNKSQPQPPSQPQPEASAPATPPTPPTPLVPAVYERIREDQQRERERLELEERRIRVEQQKLQLEQQRRQMNQELRRPPVQPQPQSQPPAQPQLCTCMAANVPHTHTMISQQLPLQPPVRAPTTTTSSSSSSSASAATAAPPAQRPAENKTPARCLPSSKATPNAVYETNRCNDLHCVRLHFGGVQNPADIDRLHAALCSKVIWPSPDERVELRFMCNLVCCGTPAHAGYIQFAAATLLAPMSIRIILTKYLRQHGLAFKFDLWARC